MNIRLLAASAVFAVAVSACGSSGSTTLPAARGAQPSAPVATAAPASGGTAATAQRSSMTISIRIPARTKISNGKRGTKTVSPATAYVDVVLQSFDGNAQPVGGPYSTLVPVSQLGACGGGGRAHARTPLSGSGCFTVSVPAPVGNAVYAVAAVDANMTLLDYAENIPVSVASGTTATLSATLNGVGSAVVGYTLPTDPQHTTQYNLQHGVDCSAYVVQYDPKAACSFLIDVADYSGDDMAQGNSISSQAYLANALALTVTDLTTQQPLNVGYDAVSPSSGSPAYEIDFDPAAPQGGLSGTTLGAGRLGTYNTVLHPDLSEIPASATDTIEFKAVLQQPATTAFGPSIVLPQSSAATFTWDLSCSNVTVGAGDPSGVAEGTVLQYCLPQQSNLNVVIQ